MTRPEAPMGDPGPFTCSFFTPSFHRLMFWQCAPLQPTPNPSYEWRNIAFSIEDILCFEALPLQAPKVCFFFFCLSYACQPYLPL